MIGAQIGNRLYIVFLLCLSLLVSSCVHGRMSDFCMRIQFTPHRHLRMGAIALKTTIRALKKYNVCYQFRVPRNLRIDIKDRLEEYSQSIELSNPFLKCYIPKKVQLRELKGLCLFILFGSAYIKLV